MSRSEPKARRLLFLLRTYNDVDHISPVIGKALNEGAIVRVIFTTDFNYQEDYRIQHLLKHPNLTVESFALVYQANRSKNPLMKLLREFVYSRTWCRRYIKRHQIETILFEWGRPQRKNLRGNFFSAAKSLQIPTICLPHGCNIFLNPDPSSRARELLKSKGKHPDFSDRNEFDLYVYQSPFHREQGILFGQLPDKTVALGSARFYPEWFEENLKICPKPESKERNLEQTKVVFMLPPWSYNVNQEESLSLLFALAEKKWVSLILKARTRGDDRLPEDVLRKLAKCKNVITDSPLHSPHLIAWADVVINFGSSIGLEALLQDKPLVHPSYLHRNETIFDTTKAAHLAQSEAEVIGYLEQARKGELKPVDKALKDQLFKEIVYGGKPSHDVLSSYWQTISKLAS